MTRVLLSFLILLGASFAQAQYFTGPSAAGLGGAGRAAVDPGESVWLNPASLPQLRGYHASTHFGFSDHEQTGKDSQFGMLLADGSQDKLFAGALSYIQRYVERPGQAKGREQEFFLAGGSPLAGTVSYGIAIHRVLYSDPNSHFIQDNGHFGLLWAPSDNVGLSLVGYDLAGSKKDVPAHIRLIPTYGFGFNYSMENVLRLRFDVTRPDQLNPGHRNNVMAGLESILHKDWRLRMGWQWREVVNQHLWTAGLGYLGPRLSFNYSFQKDVRVAGGGRHLFDLWLPF